MIHFDGIFHDINHGESPTVQKDLSSVGGAEAAGIVDELVGPGPPGPPGPPGSPRELAGWLGIALGIHGDLV